MKRPKLTTCSLLRGLTTAATALVICNGAARAADYPTTILNDNPSAYYRFEETSGGAAFDSSTNGIGATITQNGEDTSPVLGEPGIDTNSFLFIGPGPGGEGDYGFVSIPASTLITPLAANGSNSAPFSAELWVQPNGFPADFSVPIEQGAYNGGNPEGWNIYVSGNNDGNGLTSYFYLDMRPTLFQGFGAVPIQFGQWYHLVLTFDGTNATFYINGTSYGTFSVPGFVPWTSDGAHIGSGQDVGWLPFIGGVDEVAFYTNVLTASQVTNHYAVGTNSFRPANVAAGIASDLSPQTNYSGLPVTFSVTASGTLPLKYYWYSNSIPAGPIAYQWYVSTDGGSTSNQISGATNQTYWLSNGNYSGLIA